MNDNYKMSYFLGIILGIIGLYKIFDGPYHLDVYETITGYALIIISVIIIAAAIVVKKINLIYDDLLEKNKTK